jgi:HEAT repeat protein
MMQIFHEIYVLRRQAGISFFSLFGRAGVPVLIEGLQEVDQRIVKLAEEKICLMGDKAIPSLIRALKNPALSVRKQAKSTLKKIGSPAQKSLLDALQGYAKTDKELSYQISGALSWFGKNVVSDLIGLIRNGSNDSLRYVMRSLRLIDEAIPDLIQLLQDENSHVRATSAKILELMDRKAKEAIPALCKLLDDPDEDVRFRAGFAAGIIGAEPSVFEPTLTTLVEPMEQYEAYSLYWDYTTQRAHITEKNPILGEIGYDRFGRPYLRPEKEYCVGDGRMIALYGAVLRTARYGSDLVKISGFYERKSRLLVTSISNV